MERLTVERVKAAYSDTGRSPARGAFDSGDGCCGYGVVALSEFEGNVLALDEAMGSPPGYMVGFFYGFDGSQPNGGAERFGREFDKGYADGEAAAKAVGL